jgi:Protein of unknown function (DUF2637)
MFGGVIMAARKLASSLVSGCALAIVAFSTGFISYTHICALTLGDGQNWKTAHLMPLAVDGQILIGSIYFMENEGHRRRWLGLLGFLPGLAESLFANWQSGAPHGLVAAGVATVPAQAFACSTFLFERWLHARHARRAQAADGEDLLALALADADCLRESLAAASALADSALAALAFRAVPEAVPSVPEPAAPAAPAGAAVIGTPVPVVGAFMNLADRPRPKAVRQRPAAVPDAEDARLPVPDDEEELRVLVNSMSRNKLSELYQVSKYGADQLREKYLAKDDEEVSEDAA